MLSDKRYRRGFSMTGNRVRASKRRILNRLPLSEAAFGCRDQQHWKKGARLLMDHLQVTCGRCSTSSTIVMESADNNVHSYLPPLPQTAADFVPYILSKIPNSCELQHAYTVWITVSAPASLQFEIMPGVLCDSNTHAGARPSAAPRHLADTHPSSRSCYPNA